MRKSLLILASALAAVSCKDQPGDTAQAENTIDTLALAKAIHEKVITILPTP